MKRKLLAVIISVILLSIGWLGVTGLTLLVGLVPLLWISSSAEDSRKGWWSTFWYALLNFTLWNVATVWWIGYATPVGPIAATVVSTTLSMVGFMLFHTISKKAPKALSYTLLVSAWIALEYWYTMGDVSWPWLLLGNGFSNDIWAVQWYEYTGLFGGTLWVLLSNIYIFEAWQSRNRATAIKATVIAIAPIILSLIIYGIYEAPTERELSVSVVQPNIHFLESDHPDDREIERILLDLMDDAPKGVDYIVMPEAILPSYIYESNITGDRFIKQLRAKLASTNPNATLVVGASTVKFYREGNQTATSSQNRGGEYYDRFNTAIYLPSEGTTKIHHKSRLVIGTESMPLTWLADIFSFLRVDLDNAFSQLGVGTKRTVYQKDGAKVGTAICYEALYGGYCGEFIQGGAEALFVISNDCWWRDTPGYKHLFSMSALRAVEQRRAIARSANTGISGFITSRGDRLETMGWDKRGVLTGSVALNNKVTFYAKYGDYIARIAILMAILSLLKYMVVRVRKRHHLD